MDSFHVSFEHSINEKVIVLLILKEFIRILVNGIITMTVIIEEKEEHLSDITIAMHNPIASEGLLNDLNAGKSTRKEFFKEFDPYVLKITDITDECQSNKGEKYENFI